MPTTASGKLQDHRVHRQAVAGLGVDLLHRAVDLGAQHVLHLHRLDHRHGLAGFYFLAFLHRDGNDQPRHGAQHMLEAVGRLLHRHQPGERSFPFGIDIGFGFDPAIRERETVWNSAHLYRDAMTIDGTRPYRFARLPVRDELVPGRLADEPHFDGLAGPTDFQVLLLRAEPDRTLAVAHDAAAVHLPGNAPLALAEHGVDRRRRRRDHGGAFALRRLRVETFRKFLGDEAGR